MQTSQAKRPAFSAIRMPFRLGVLLAVAAMVWGEPVAAETSADVYENVRFVDHLSDLPADLAWMQKHDKPMMLFFHASYCGYCRKIDEEFLIPMRLDPDYQGRLIIRRVQIDSDHRLIDADGELRSTTSFADQLDVRGVPYVLFFSPDGERVGEITGAAPAFYDHYLNRNIDRAEHCAKDMGPAECREFMDRPGLK